MVEPIQRPINYIEYAGQLDEISRQNYARLESNVDNKIWTVLVGGFASGKSSMLKTISKSKKYGPKSYFDMSDCPSPAEIERNMAQQRGLRQLNLSELPSVLILDEFTDINLSGDDMRPVIDLLTKCRDAGKTVIISCRREPINPKIGEFFTDKMTLEQIPPERWLKK